MKPQTNQKSTVRLSIASAPAFTPDYYRDKVRAGVGFIQTSTPTSPVFTPDYYRDKGRAWIGILFLLFCSLSFSQTWQWGKSGGSGSSIGFNGTGLETAKAMATDAQGNVFMIADVGGNFLKVDGNVKTHYGVDADRTNGILASFTCNGTYRWSKVIGGQYNSFINDVKTDAAGNVYVIGRFLPVGSGQPNTFDGTYNVPLAVSLPNSMMSNYYETYFAKYSNVGILQWVKFVENTVNPSAFVSNENIAQLYKIEIDTQGNFYILAFLTNGTFFNGALSNTLGNGYHVLKYDNQGTFISAVRIDISVNNDWNEVIKFKRNNNTGQFYFVNRFNSNNPANTLLIGGIPFTKNQYLAKFSPTGSLIWKRENASNITVNFNNIQVETDNSIFYLGNAYLQINTVFDTFAGVSFPIDPIAPSVGSYTVPYIIKFSPDGVPIWSNNPLRAEASSDAIKINGNEVALAMSVRNTNWGDITYSYPAGDATDVAIARLNKNTGEFITMSKIPSFPNTRNSGTSITSDALGNYYVGGNFSSILFPGAGQLNTTGGNNDFFIAKYGTSNCNCQLPTCSFRAINTASNLNIFNFRYYGQEVYTSVSWNFGDGTPLSTQVNPTHTFAQPSIYNVCLTATNACGTQTFCSNVNTAVLGIKDEKLEVANLMTLAPNPASTFCRIDYEVQTPNAFITIYDLNGKLIEQNNIKNDLKGSWKIDVRNYAAGIYMVTVQIPDGALLQRKLNVTH